MDHIRNEREIEKTVARQVIVLNRVLLLPHMLVASNIVGEVASNHMLAILSHKAM